MYLTWAIRRFGWREGLARFVLFDVWPFLNGTRLRRRWRRRWRRWRRIDRRPRGHGSTKTAINRDGNFFLVECPVCHDQSVWFDKDRRWFLCGGGRADGHYFRVYTEDGVMSLADHRKGPVVGWPAIVVRDDAAKVWRLGLSRDAPWWWTRRELYRDLQPSGKDGHGHQPYRLVPPEEQPVAVQEARACVQESPA